MLNCSLKQLTDSFVSDSTFICGSIWGRRTYNAAVSPIIFHKHALQTQAHFIKSTCRNCIEGHCSRTYYALRSLYSRKETPLSRNLLLDIVFESCSAFCYIRICNKSHARTQLKKYYYSFYFCNCRPS